MDIFTEQDEIDSYDRLDDCDNDGISQFREVVRAIDFNKIKELALGIRLKEMADLRPTMNGVEPQVDNSLSCRIDFKPMRGSFNIVFVIRWSDGVKWVVRIPGDGLQYKLMSRMKMSSEYQTMEYIRKRTKIPIPRIFAWETDPTVVGAPFALLEYIEGKPLHRFWRRMGTSKETKIRILHKIAQHMSQLYALEFPEMGMLSFNNSEEEPFISCAILNKVEYLNPWGTVYMQDYHPSLETLLMATLKDRDHSDQEFGSINTLEVAIASMPEFLRTRGPFYLSAPDLDMQNIMIDEQENITGYIDWDNVMTLPAAAGFGRYPMWITEDWKFPVYAGMHPRPVEDIPFNASQGLLSEYRRHYHEAFVKACGPGYDERQTRFSDIVEAIWFGVERPRALRATAVRLLKNAKVTFTMQEWINAGRARDPHRLKKQIEDAFRLMWETPGWDG